MSEHSKEPWQLADPYQGEPRDVCDSKGQGIVHCWDGILMWQRADHAVDELAHVAPRELAVANARRIVANTTPGSGDPLEGLVD